MKNKGDAKRYLAMLGMECLFMAVATLAACLAALVQFVGRTKIGRTSSILFPGDLYQYNYFSYIAGMVIFLAFFLFVHIKFLGKYTAFIVEYRIVWAVIYWIIDVVLSFGMFCALIMIHFMKLNLVDSMSPDFLILVTIYGWPVFSAVFTGIDLIIKRGKHSDENLVR